MHSDIQSFFFKISQCSEKRPIWCNFNYKVSETVFSFQKRYVSLTTFGAHFFGVNNPPEYNSESGGELLKPLGATNRCPRVHAPSSWTWVWTGRQTLCTACFTQTPPCKGRAWGWLCAPAVFPHPGRTRPSCSGVQGGWSPCTLPGGDGRPDIRWNSVLSVKWWWCGEATWQELDFYNYLPTEKKCSQAKTLPSNVFKYINHKIIYRHQEKYKLCPYILNIIQSTHTMWTEHIKIFLHLWWMPSPGRGAGTRGSQLWHSRS